MNNARNLATGACMSFWQIVKNNPRGAMVIVVFLALVGLFEGTRIVDEIKNPSIGKNLFGSSS